MSVLFSRRHALKTMGCGFGYLAFAGLAHEATANPLAPRPTHHPARAKRVLFIFMQGGPSHVDTFDPKPRLIRNDGQMRSFDDARTFARDRRVVEHRVMKSPWRFRQHGSCGRSVSELFPHIARHVDDL